MKRSVALIALLVLIVPGVAWPQGLSTATPEAVGLSSPRLARVTEAVKGEIAKGRYPGAVALVARRGKVAYFEALGQRDPQTGAPMTKDAIFRLYSMTKPFTSVATMMLLEDGRLLLNDPVSKYIPKLKGLQVSVPRVDPQTGKVTYALVPAEREMTIQDLLRHTSGQFYQERIFTPLKMTDTTFLVPNGKVVRLAQPFAKDPVTGAAVALLDVTQPQKNDAGGAGTAGTVMDYARFSQMLLNGGQLDRVRLLGRATVAQMSSDHLGDIRLASPILPRGYGFG